MDQKCYCLGLSGETKLVCEEDDIFSYTTKEDNKKILVTGKKSEKSMTLKRML